MSLVGMSMVNTQIMLLNSLTIIRLMRGIENDEYYRSLDTEYDTGVGFLDYPEPSNIISKFIKNLKRNYNKLNHERVK